MQNLYYSGSGVSSSLTLVEENGSVSSWTDILLIVCGSLDEIIITSGSQNIAAFPIDTTNIFYGVAYKGIINNALTFPTTLYTKLNTYFYLLDIDGDIPLTNDPGYYISSSANNYYVILSGSSAFIPPPSAGYTSVSGSATFIIPTGSYNIGVYISGSWPYSGSIAIYDITTNPTEDIPLIEASGSVDNNIAITSSIFLSASHVYNAYLIISGGYIKI